MLKQRELRRAYREAGALNTLVSVHAAVDERTFLTKGGDLLQVCELRGADDGCWDAAESEQLIMRFESAIRGFDPRFRIYQYMVKRRSPEIPARRYSDPTVQRALDQRARHLLSRSESLYSFSLHLVVVYEGARSGQNWTRRLERFRQAPLEALQEAFGARARFAGIDHDVSLAAGILTQKVEAFALQLHDLLPARVLGKDEAFVFLRGLLNYNRDKARAVGLAYNTFVDYQLCNSHLDCHRDHLRLDDDYVKVLTLKTPPARTFAHLFKALDALPCDSIVCTEWQALDGFAAQRLLASKRRHFHNSKTSLLTYATSTSKNTTPDHLTDQGAIAVVADLGACLEDLEVQNRYLGSFSLSIVLFHPDLAVVQRAVAACLKTFGTHDAQLTEERYNLQNAWLAILPGNSAHNLRRLWLVSSNYADLALVFEPDVAEPTNTYLATEYLAVLETSAGTPYFLNLHCHDNAHALVLGATGSGKSFLLNFLLTQLQKYDPRTFIFDLGASYRKLTSAFAGAYLELGKAVRGVTINPFALPDTPDNRQFLNAFCRVLIESGDYRMSAPDERDLAEQITSLYEVAPPERRLRTLASILARPLRVQLERWVEGGPHGDLFDNAEDTLTLANFQTFDGDGMDRTPQALELVLFYLLHRASAVIADPATLGTFKVFVVDEAWRFFQHPAVKRYIVEALKTWRKKNAAMILATQSLEDLRQSELLSVVAESCATKFFLANPGMDPATYRDVFHLNDTESTLIRQITPKREFLLKQPDRAAVLSLSVGAEEYDLYSHRFPYAHTHRRVAQDGRSQEESRLQERLAPNQGA